MKKSTRLHFLLLAFSIFVLVGVMGLSAYLNDAQYYSSSYRTAASDELGFSITGSQLSDQLITPGETLLTPISVKVTGDYPLYVFIDYDPPAGLVVGGFNQGWHPIEEGSNIYYYGSDSSPVSLDKTNNPEVSILESIKVPTETGNGQSFALNITGYAVQSEFIPSGASIQDIFEMAKPASTNNP